MEIPDPAAIDWTSVAGWAAGIVTVLTSIGLAMWQAIKRAGRIAATLPAAQVDTKIMTADTVAMDRLAGTMEAANVILTENNTLRREEHADRTANRASLEASTRAMETLIFEMRELRGEVRGLAFELAKSTK